MHYRIIVLPEAMADIISLFEYVAGHDSTGKAEALFEKIEERCASLAALPERGHVVPELARIQVYLYREIHFKPYRIIYQTVNDTVFIHAVLDGRRDLSEHLERRLLS